jgi:hypothetical protein
VGPLHQGQGAVAGTHPSAAKTNTDQQSPLEKLKNSIETMTGLFSNGIKFVIQAWTETDKSLQNGIMASDNSGRNCMTSEKINREKSSETMEQT